VPVLQPADEILLLMKLLFPQQLGHRSHVQPSPFA
jgi:hypothetical protein